MSLVGILQYQIVIVNVAWISGIYIDAPEPEVGNVLIGGPRARRGTYFIGSRGCGLSRSRCGALQFASA